VIFGVRNFLVNLPWVKRFGRIVFRVDKKRAYLRVTDDA